MAEINLIIYFILLAQCSQGSMLVLEEFSHFHLVSSWRDFLVKVRKVNDEVVKALMLYESFVLRGQWFHRNIHNTQYMAMLLMCVAEMNPACFCALESRNTIELRVSLLSMSSFMIGQILSIYKDCWGVFHLIKTILVPRYVDYQQLHWYCDMNSINKLNDVALLPQAWNINTHVGLL